MYKDADAKTSISGWWILALMSLFLWYRNQRYDRALSVFIFTLAMVQLIEYGIHSGADPEQSGRALFITLWLQCLVLAIGVYIFINDNKDLDNPSINDNIVQNVAGWNLFFFAIIFLIALILTYTSENSFLAQPGKSGYIEWYVNNDSMLGRWGWLYFLGIFTPLTLIFAYYLWADLQIAILILYGILSALYVFANYNSLAFSSVWSYLMVGFAFLAWFMGMLSTDNNTLNNTNSLI